MARRFSDIFGISSEALAEEGAFNPFVDVDSTLHVDPYLLRTTSVPEFANSYHRFRKYFVKVVRLLDASQNSRGRLFREAARRLTFKEPDFVCLGYGRGNTAGSGIGSRLAYDLARTASEIVAAGIKDPIIFELAGLFEEGIGADRISDMTVRIILPDLLAFSQRVARNLDIKTREIAYDNTSYKLPAHMLASGPVVLVPADLLRYLPVAREWSDIDYVCAYNEQLRHIVNQIIGETWRTATRYVPKRDLRHALLTYPGLFRDLIEQYSEKSVTAYDFQSDPQGLFIWQNIGREFAERYPLDLESFARPSDLLAIVTEMCNRFKQLVEFNGLNEVLYSDGNLRHERFAQLLFYAVADAYCAANDLDLSREANAGRGPVDFKISRGYRARVTIEVKYSSNNALVRGYRTQLPIYNQGERTSHSIYLVLRTTKSTSNIEAVTALREKALKDGGRVPEIIVLDARLKPSASKASSVY